ncbi:plasmid mobilization protein [Pseudomonas monteilii]|jgi:uncharacterized protein (DUF1778 family)|uniref:plasmid mobilization protein n=1 Tax=Pseudomonas monteilii TaxID=76759 RepID=UPI001E5323AA|nr:plasmid mobilization relaxosome protein MobC [Pseudomonas monteilii]MCE0874850.1 plasmid mobilization relaxosome protein MobC [Pseudomonas monteilii]MCE0925712.1 plasmid mobilization relaxosome protein MobC [Pseudomonas monteilii]MCE0929772.1 plasmid mobilization relaxosome protein MobC [Pseudomonas monteilii]MCE0976888.1 plasmid mobilization relaxosome protein MobC [Pseudomonas monteilii]MCE1012413.1 plasmid mobilization relaxosome protein MobC [Pseudomonas monteilii]
MAKKDIQLNVRVSKEAKQLIADNAKLLGMKQGEYIETIARKGLNQVVEINNPSLMSRYDEIEQALDKVGININQIAKYLNSGNNPNSRMEATFSNVLKVFSNLHVRLEKCQDKKIIFNNQEE